MKGGPIASVCVRRPGMVQLEKKYRGGWEKERAKHYTGKPKASRFAYWRSTKDLGTFARFLFSRIGQRKMVKYCFLLGDMELEPTEWLKLV